MPYTTSLYTLRGKLHFMPLSLPPEIKAIVFDAYGTLLDVQRLDEFLEHHFGEKASDINKIWRQKQLQYTWLRSLMRRYEPFSKVTADALRYACTSLGLKLPDALEQELVQQYYQLQAFPDVAETLATLSREFQLAVLSNANEEMLHQAIKHNRLAGLLTQVLSVDQIGKFKPTPEVYRLAESNLKLDREQIVFVSSNTWDVAGAASFGLRVIWLNRGNGNMEDLGFSPDWQIPQLGEIRRAS